MRSTALRATLRCALAVLIGVAGQAASAQCGTSTYTGTINCNTQFCSQSVTQHLYSDGGPYGIHYSCSTVSCCGQSYPTCSPSGWSCNGSGKLADPAIRQRLLELAKSEDIMVTSCKGEYRPLVIALAEQPAPKPAEQLDLRRARPKLLDTARGGQ